MKQFAKTLIGMLIVVLSVSPLSAFAESFHYDFDDLKKDDWELWGNHSVWQVKGHESFTITLKNLGSKHANIGVAIGRRFPDIDKTHAFFYVFNTYGIEARTYDWFSAGPWWIKEPRHPDVLGVIRELAFMEIRFNRGHFQWFANDEKRADFEDPDFSQIEILGFLLQADLVNVGSAWVDSFTISGSGLAVSPQAKLSTMWGTLKQLR